jgi:hypothetical protein
MPYTLYQGVVEASFVRDIFSFRFSKNRSRAFSKLDPREK